jgi:hypothetical protein
MTTGWRTVLILVLLVPVLAAAKCEGGRGKQKQACDLRESKPPTWMKGSGKGSISASVTAYCDRPPKRHTLKVWLEREGTDGKSWFQVGQPSAWDKPADIPPPPPGRTYTITVGCIDGNWRVRARAEGLSPDGNPFTFTLPAAESWIRVVRCRIQ